MELGRRAVGKVVALAGGNRGSTHTWRLLVLINDHHGREVAVDGVLYNLPGSIMGAADSDKDLRESTPAQPRNPLRPHPCAWAEAEAA